MTSYSETIYPEPRPLAPETAPAPLYPLQQLPPLMRDAAEAIAEHVQAPHALAGQCVIGAATCLAQTRVNAPHLHRPEGMPSSLFMLTLANSADRKSECRRLAFRVIDDAEHEARSAHRQQCQDAERGAARLKGKARDEYLAEHPEPADPRSQYADATFEPIAGDMIRGTPAASWDTDEGSQLFGGASFKSDTRAATLGGLVKAFDSGTFERTRSRGNLEGSGVAYNRRLTIHVLAQPVAVAEALSDPLLREQGFLARFLFADAPSLAGTRFLTPDRLQASPYRDPRLHQWWDRCRAILASPAHITPASEVKPPSLSLTDEALAAWVDHYNETEAEQGALGDFASVRPFAGRAGEIARRLAAVFACFEQQAVIDGDLMRRACALARHSVQEWARYIEGGRLCPDLAQAAALMDWIREKSWSTFDARQLQKNGPQSVRKSAKARDRILAILLEHNHLLVSSGNQFLVNPAAAFAAPAASRAEAVVELCDTVAATCDKATNHNDLPQPAASAPQALTPANTRVAANAANAAGQQNEKGAHHCYTGVI